jgi:SAM-dependent methyltransferase
LEKEECKICQNNKFKFIDKPRTSSTFPRSLENNYSTLQCSRCGYYFLNPAIDLSQDEWAAMYDGNYFRSAEKTRWRIQLREAELKERMDYIVRNLEIAKGKFLDMGCGEGYMLQKSEINGFEPYGVDIALNLIPDFAGKYKFFKGNIADAKFPDEFFSVIYMDSVLEHVPDPGKTVEELKRILKPGGLLLIIVPNEDSLMNSFAKWCYYLTFNKRKYGKIKPFIQPYHIQGFNRNSLKFLFNRFGLEVLFIKDFGGGYRFWKEYKAFSKQHIIELIRYPVGLLSVITGNQIQLMSLTKK